MERLDPVAIVGGRCFTGLRDVTDDISALDGTGLWVVVVRFEGEVLCARFDHAGPIPTAPPWAGPPLDAWSTSLDRHDFSKAVIDIREAIAAGDVYEVNLCRVLTAPAPTTGTDVTALGAALRTANPSPFGAVVRLPGTELASASPELFLRRDDGEVESRPIKGTAPTGAAFTAKDRAENVMIVDLVRNDLGRVCEYGSVEVPGLCETEQHPGLDQLVSTVRGRLRADVGWPELLAATFPPGSVTGAPKLAALDVIGKLEPVRRGPYCGTIGWVDADRRTAELNVAIRTFWLQDERLHFGTGGAITWDSTAEGEWAETELKAARLMRIASKEA